MDSRGNGADRAATARPPGLFPVDSRGKTDGSRHEASLTEELEIPLEGTPERNRFDSFVSVVNFKCQPGSSVWPGTALERTLVRLADELDERQAAGVVRRFDTGVSTGGKAPGLVVTLERTARELVAREARLAEVVE